MTPVPPKAMPEGPAADQPKPIFKARGLTNPCCNAMHACMHACLQAPQNIRRSPVGRA